MKKWITVSLTLVAFAALVVALSRWWLPLLGLAGAGNEALRSLDGIGSWLVWIFICALALLIVNLRWDRLFSRNSARRLVDEAEEWSDDFRIGETASRETAKLELVKPELAKPERTEAVPPAPALPTSKVRLFPEQLEPVERPETLPVAAAPVVTEPVKIAAPLPAPPLEPPVTAASADTPADDAPPVAYPATNGPLALVLRPPQSRERVTVAFADLPETEFVEVATTGELAPPPLTLESEDKLTPSDIANAATIAQAEQVPASYFQLPALPAGFSGRAAELHELHVALTAATYAGLCLHGAGGSGKTALALALAHQVSAQYPDAQLFLDLQGTGLRPLTLAEIQQHVLRIFAPSRVFPVDEAALQAAYTETLAGKRVLLVFDNAPVALSVAALLPPTGSMVLLTARQPVAATEAKIFELAVEPLTAAAAETCLLELVPRCEGRAPALAELCGNWPAALQLAASALLHRPELTAASYESKLRQVVQRLQADAAPPPVEPALTLSYELLNPGLQKLWRTLAVFPDSFDVTGAAAVWGLHPERALRALRRLMDFELLEGNPLTGRYRLHDLKQSFANRWLRAAERGVALQNHAEYYQSVLHEADALYEQGGAALKRGLGLVDRDWHNIEAGQTWAAVNAATEQAACELCSSYPDAGRYVLELRQSPRERLRWCQAALEAAHRLNRHKAESRHLLALGQAHFQLGELEAARENYERALALTREQADYGGLARALNGLGTTAWATGAWPAAQAFFAEALELARTHADQRNEAAALGGLAALHSAQGDWPAAQPLFEQQLALLQTSGDLARLGQAHFVFAQACHTVGARAQALSQAQTALTLLHQLESPLAEAVRAQLEQWQA